MDFRGTLSSSDLVSGYKLTTPLSAPTATCFLDADRVDVIVPSSLAKRSTHRCVRKSHLYSAQHEKSFLQSHVRVASLPAIGTIASTHR